jgi:hypothetical protein
MKRSTVLLVLILAVLLIAAGVASRGKGSLIARWIAAHRTNSGH